MSAFDKFAQFRQNRQPLEAGETESVFDRVRNRAEADFDAPNRAERAIAEFLQDKPTLQRVLGSVGQVGSGVSNLLEAGVLGVQGEGGQALDRLQSAGRNFGGFVLDVPDALIPGDVLPNLTRPQDFNNFSNVLKTAGVGQLGEADLPLIGRVTGRGAIGLLGDIVTDPLNLAAGPIARAATPAVQGAKNLLRTKTPLRALSTGSPETIAAANRAMIAGGTAARRFEESLGDVWRQAQKEAARQGIPPEAAAARFVEAIESKTITDPIMAPFAVQSRKVLEDILDAEMRAGVNVAALQDPGLNYLTRVLTPEAWDALVKTNKLPNAQKFVNDWSARHGSTKARKAIYEGKTVKEINDFIRNQVGRTDFDLFTTDPARIAATRSRRAGRAIRSSEFFQSVLRDFAIPATPAAVKGGAQSLDDILRSRGLTPEAGPFVGSSGKMVPKDVAQAIDQTLSVWTDPATPRGLLGTLIKSTQAFKALVTAPFPAFHFRNAVSNVWANYLSGLKNPTRYSDAVSLVRDLRSGGTKAWPQYGGLTSKEIIDSMGTGRALGFGSQSAAELTELASVRGGTLLDVAKKAGKGRLIAAGREVGEIIEDNAKIAHVLDRLAKGDSIDDAILSAKKYLFDYGELSPIEKRLFRNVVPFWTFARRNLPLQLESLFTKPGRVADINHLQNFVQARNEGGEGVDTTVIPHWVRRRLFGFDRNDDGSLDVSTGLGIGLEELSFLDRPFDEFVAMINPIFKAPLQAAMNKDFFRDVPLDKADAAPAAFRHLPKVVKEWMDFRPVRDRSGQVRFYRANPRVLNTLWGLPFVGGTSRAFNVASQFDPSQDRAGRPDPLVRNITGFRSSTMSPQQQIRENMRRLMQAHVKRMEELQREGVTFELDDKFGVRRDAVQDPRAREAKAINRELRRTTKALSRLSRTEQAALLQEGLRTGAQ